MDGLTRRELFAGTAALAASRWIPAQEERKVGWAILGLGGYALNQIMPAFRDCKRSQIAAVISGSPDKAKRVAGQYGLPDSAIYSYETMGQIRENPAIDVVYVITPPGTHREFSVRAAEAGKHVCCEKPMAPTVADCQAIIDACRKADRLLQIGYRSHYQAHNMRAIQACRSELGRLRSITADAGFNIGRGSWRTDRKLAGGGAMMDIGIYAVQALRYLSGEEPAEVVGYISNPPNDERFREVEDTVHFTLRFPSGTLGTGSSGYSWRPGLNRYTVAGQSGGLTADPATSYGGHRLWIRGQEQEIAANNQFAAQMDHLSECILQKKPVLTPGEMGLQDIRIIQAIYDAAKTGRPVRL